MKSGTFTFSIILFAFLGLVLNSASGQKYEYTDSWSEEGIKLVASENQKVELNYSIEEFNLEAVTVNREEMLNVTLPGHFLPNDEGKPNLPGKGWYIAVPEGATPKLKITDFRTEKITEVEIAPAFRIPWDTDKSDLYYEKDQSVYSANAFYPENPVQISELKQIRGVDVVMLGVTPFQYNPVTKELLVYRDLKMEITFEGGNGTFGKERLRSRWFDPIVEDALLNRDALPQVDYNSLHASANREEGCEYLIVSPNDAVFQQWADSIKEFRTRQGIFTKVVTLDEIGGNDVNTLKTYFSDAYNNWDMPPAAVLLLGDYGTNPANSIISPIWDNYCVSDNIFSDVDNDDMPDMVFARITARDASELEVMITKFLNHERTPPTNPDYYNNPITALGWQTERWFQICSETVGGYFKNVQGKNPVRINEVYDGNPDVDPWSTSANTNIIMNYFNGLGYIPMDPSDLGNWDGGDATDINNAINAGSFLLQHRDHGYELGWGEPDYSNPNINGLNNTGLVFVMSINCLTGKYNWGSESFTEKFHRYTYNGQNSGALGLIAASEVSYSFVNDTYVWGLYDNMWPDFMPNYGTTPDSRGLMPAFGNAAGKYFLEQSSWPWNTGNKEVTYNLFHHHGGAFLTLYSEVPQNLTIAHNPVLLGGETSFTVTADEGSFIALTANGEILATADGTGAPVQLSIPAQTPGSEMVVTVTKQNYYRYEEVVPVISPDGAYCVYDAHSFTDENGNDMMEYAEEITFTIDIKNLGLSDASNVDVVLQANDEYISITDSVESYGNIPSEQVVSVADGFSIQVASDIPDMHKVVFNVVASDADNTWGSSFIGEFHAPVISMGEVVVNDASGNNNGRIDPGENVQIEVEIINSGSAEAMNVMAELGNNDTYVNIISGEANYGNLAGGNNNVQAFELSAMEDTPGGFNAQFAFDISADFDLAVADTFNQIIGQFAALVLDLDENSNSGQAIMAAFDDTELIAQYAEDFPNEDLIYYKSIFLCTGIHYSSYILSEAEGERLADYLDQGGNLYLEGRTTWVDEPQTEVHGMFGMNVEEVTWYQYDEIRSEDATFVHGMDYLFAGTNPYNNHYFEAVSPAYNIFTTQDEPYACAVANDAGDYKTIASNFEIGGLVDGEDPATKDNLIKKYLAFFGVLDYFVSTPENNISNTTAVTAYPNPGSDMISFTLNVENAAGAELKIFNTSGQMIRRISANDQNNSGIIWDCSNSEGKKVNSGIYFYQIEFDGTIHSGKVSVMN